ncbi:uncharacterized protein LOC103718691 [Phoenix dactylifera]|uniref:Uncharacterized protein LOC103718691 n=1 Tax=Phoenix dactylifera TaxID=42345 RepID=A0A8B9A9J7_PHODC|nr:uncharacterized protein LOC103718691 [Phoenix dactylifera]
MKPDRESSGGDGGGQTVAENWLGIAEELLDLRDLVGTKRFAERALESDPLVDGADEVLAIANVLLASQRRLNNQCHWYAVLQLDSSTPAGRDPAAVRRQYRRLALLLCPDRNRHRGASDASKLVEDAWSVLSDPSKKALFDLELDIAIAHGEPPPSSSATPTSASPSPPRPDPTFWTACPSCCHVHQYDRAYEGRNLRCPKCRQAFRATALAAPPPIVPGTEMYYCSWGFFPLGFPGGPSFSGVSASVGMPSFSSEWKPFYPMFPSASHQSQQPPVQRNAPMNTPDSPAGSSLGNAPEKATPLTMKTPETVTSLGSNRKVVAKKSVGSSLRKRALVSEAAKRSLEGTAARPVIIDINEDGEN